MMGWLFGTKRHQHVASMPPLPPPSESTLDRRHALLEQRAKLQRAHALKSRSRAVADSLRTREQKNHYSEGLRQSYEATRNREKRA